jgi:hypothetical protein
LDRVYLWGAVRKCGDYQGRAWMAAQLRNDDRPQHFMKLNHLNLTITDVAETRQFFEKYSKEKK